jgi:hypothetical protein
LILFEKGTTFFVSQPAEQITVFFPRVFFPPNRMIGKICDVAKNVLSWILTLTFWRLFFWSAKLLSSRRFRPQKHFFSSNPQLVFNFALFVRRVTRWVYEMIRPKCSPTHICQKE